MGFIIKAIDILEVVLITQEDITIPRGIIGEEDIYTLDDIIRLIPEVLLFAEIFTIRDGNGRLIVAF